MSFDDDRFRPKPDHSSCPHPPCHRQHGGRLARFIACSYTIDEFVTGGAGAQERAGRRPEGIGFPQPDVP